MGRERKWGLGGDRTKLAFDRKMSDHITKISLSRVYKKKNLTNYLNS